MNLKKYIKNKSKELEIDIIGFTNAEQFEDTENSLKLRREKNYETEFEEVDIKKRISPKQILSTGKSIIVIGVPYYINTDDKVLIDENISRGRLSKSAIGLDYHIRLKRKMEKLVEYIESIHGDFEYSIGVDTTPLLDRHLAKRAGVGWYGKNSTIINDKYGSFIFLGYIITDIEIEADRYVDEKCGDCNICIISCPVGAIKPNYEFNAKRCISYLTQTKAEIPYNLRDKMGDKLYGCDTCQLVCPKNKDIIESQELSLNLENLVEFIKIEELFDISNKEFKRKYGNVAFSWRGKNVIKRNGIIALGNSKKKLNIELLKKGLKDESKVIRKYSAWAILKLDTELGKDILDNHKINEKDDSVIQEIEKLKKYFKIS